MFQEFTQKSVVHYRGWLGTVSSTERKVLLQLGDDTTIAYDLKAIRPNGTSSVLETHWINELVDDFFTRNILDLPFSAPAHDDVAAVLAKSFSNKTPKVVDKKKSL